ncbi:MAG: magnesium transporter CorA family protein [Elstera sp.]
MLSAYGLADTRLIPLPTLPADARAVRWIDLHNPNPDEEKATEALLGIDIPTAEDRRPVEESARLYRDNGALVMTAVIITGVAEGQPLRTQITFVMTETTLVTVRRVDPLPFRTFVARVCTLPPEDITPEALLVGLLEAILERAADVLERVAADLNEVSLRLFFKDIDQKKPLKSEEQMQALLRRLGRKRRISALLRESLFSFDRLVPFLAEQSGADLTADCRTRLTLLLRDIRSLTAFEAQLSAEVSYLHEAIIGLITLEQNQIVKVFSILAVLFLPPTLVGSIYGMNFDFMPELQWRFGYLFSLALMLASALVPFFWLRRKGWI